MVHITHDDYPTTDRDRKDAALIAEGFVGSKNYSASTMNCQHFVNDVLLDSRISMDLASSELKVKVAHNFDSITQAAGRVFHIKPVKENILKMLEKCCKTLADSLSKWGDKFIEGIKGSAEKLADLAKKACNKLKDLVSPLTKRMEELGKSILDKVKSVGKPIVDKLKTYGGKAVKVIQDFGESLAKQIKEYGKPVAEKLRDIGSTVSKKLTEFTAPAVQKVKGWCSPLIQKIKGWCKPLVDKIKSWVKSKATSANCKENLKAGKTAFLFEIAIFAIQTVTELWHLYKGTKTSQDIAPVLIKRFFGMLGSVAGVMIVSVFCPLLAPIGSIIGHALGYYIGSWFCGGGLESVVTNILDFMKEKVLDYVFWFPNKIVNAVKQIPSTLERMEKQISAVADKVQTVARKLFGRFKSLFRW